MNCLVQKLRASSLFNRHHKDKTNLFISIYPSNKGGGSNTFAYNFQQWLKDKPSYNHVFNISKADRAIVIADKIKIEDLKRARERGCFIIHRLDEHVELNEDEYRTRKHAYIRSLNKLADVTVYQSDFVFANMHPFLDSPERYEIILNGAVTGDFYPAENPGDRIGHITWGVGDKKRLDIVYDTIRQNPDERFLLIGNHLDSKYDFASLSNAECVGTVQRSDIVSYLHKMKFLFFPSENDPCPNTVIEAIVSGLPVCYNPLGGTIEIVKDCGLPIDEFKKMLEDYSLLKDKCLSRKDLTFDTVARKYMSLN